jgi:acetylornithine deacetylase/succinyl-diaminopimelate desuccinylase-like protein
LHVPIPDFYTAQAKESTAILGEAVYGSFPFIDAKVRPVSADPVELLLNRYWRPELSVTGMEGLPAIRDAGNVIPPFARAKLSLRLPPGVDAQQAGHILQQLFESDPPYNARVKYAVLTLGNGWVAPPLAPWLAKAANEASLAYFGKKPAYMGKGGTIAFMSTLGENFPDTQFFTTGILGPGSNAHAADESLDLDAARRVTMCVAHIIAEHRRGAAADR